MQQIRDFLGRKGHTAGLRTFSNTSITLGVKVQDTAESARVRVNFVGDQDHLQVPAGQETLIWLCTYSPDGRLASHRRR
jgi:hypothetical protein